MKVANIEFPEFTGIRCLMMPYIQGDAGSLPDIYKPYSEIIKSVFIERGDIGYLTIDESVAIGGTPHRGYRARHGRALHTEAGRHPDMLYAWGSGGGSWGGSRRTLLDENVSVLLANNVDDSCAIWDVCHWNTSIDGDIGNLSNMYPYNNAIMMKSGEVHKIGILTPHESLPIKETMNRQFLRIVSSGVHGREEYFTENPLME